MLTVLNAATQLATALHVKQVSLLTSKLAIATSLEDQEDYLNHRRTVLTV